MNLDRKLAFCCLFLSNMAIALPDDSHAVLNVRAGKAALSQTNHQGIFSDNVELDQGSTHIRALKAITETNDKNQLIKAVIIGNVTKLAHYWTLISQDKPTLHAYAKRIEYYPEAHLIKLIGHAHVTEGNNSFSAPAITYNTLTQDVTTEKQHDARTLIVFHPESESRHPILFDKLKTDSVSKSSNSTPYHNQEMSRDAGQAPLHRKTAS